tara:strand:+ start:355 stop:546 length:192 start_codon:yes stop_codon:yes gene_type:complete
MSYLQTLSYKKLPKGKKVYTEEVIASTPSAAKNAVSRRLGVEIAVVKCLTSVPSSVEGAPPNV